MRIRKRYQVIFCLVYVAAVIGFVVAMCRSVDTQVDDILDKRAERQAIIDQLMDPR